MVRFCYFLLSPLFSFSNFLFSLSSFLLFLASSSLAFSSFFCLRYLRYTVPDMAFGSSSNRFLVLVVFLDSLGFFLERSEERMKELTWATHSGHMYQDDPGRSHSVRRQSQHGSFRWGTLLRCDRQLGLRVRQFWEWPVRRSPPVWVWASWLWTYTIWLRPHGSWFGPAEGRNMFC